MAVEIKQALEREFEVILTAQELRTLTFGKLQELMDGKGDKTVAIQDAAADESESPRNMLLSGLGYEKNANSVIIPLNITESNKNGDVCALFIPGIEGVISETAQKSCKVIEVPVYGLQLHSNCKEESFENLISLISNVSHSKFY